MTNSRVARILLILVIALLPLVAAEQLLVIVRDFSKPSEITYPNSVMVFHARELAEGRPIYRDFNQAPHIPAP